MSRIYDALLRAEKDRASESAMSGEGSKGANAPLGSDGRSPSNDETEFRGSSSNVLQGMEKAQATAEDDLPFVVREQAMFSAAPEPPYVPPQERRTAVFDDPRFTSRSAVAEAGVAEAGFAPPASDASFGSQDFPEAPKPEMSAWMSGTFGEPREVAWHPDRKSLPALESRGALIEQIRVLRSRLHEIRLDRSLKVIMITSGLPQEGKSFVASNLAVGIAKFRNQRVLLIDADMRRGRLHTVLGAPQEPGLTDYLANRASLAEVMQQMERPESGEFKNLASLTFIASGHDADNAADLSGNGRFQRLIQAVYEHFDWIIVDSSPVTLVADGVNLARVCDGVVMVVRAGITKYEVAQRAQQELKAAKIVGVVLNAIQNAPEVGYYGYDG